MRELKKAILKTLAYSSIFSYPLRPQEIYRYLVVDNPVDREVVFRALKVMEADEKQIQADRGYYFLWGRKEVVGLRKRREKWSREKIKKAQRIANFLKILPTVKLVGISGALAMGNADEGDDIDLFVVTSAGRLWLTRFLVTVLVELMGQRRRPLKPNLTPEVGELPPKAARKTSGVGEEAIRDKICLNMFLDENYLTIPLKERNLFTAHEVVQMKPLWEREDTYQRFLAANLWVGKWLANSLRNTKHETRDTKNKPFLPLCPFVNCLERLLMNFQLKYMQKRRTTEKISPGRILFHPEDKSRWVMGEWEKRLKKFEDPSLID